ncbi:MAG: hypothetical protein V7782_14900 [Psychromonas sp.]
MIIRSHSHSHYYRDDPFYGAVELGFDSYEAYVFNNEGYDEVYFADDAWVLAFQWSFNDLYVKPLVDYVRKQNHEFYDG